MDSLGGLSRETIQFASPALRENKDFMLQVVKRDTSLLRFAPIHLQQDFDLALLAFSGDPGRVARYFDPAHSTYEGRDKFARQFIESIKAMPKMRKIFQSTVLPLINHTDPSGQASALSILNQGVETSSGYMKLLQDFLVPSAKQVAMIYRACSTVPNAMGEPREILEGIGLVEWKRRQTGRGNQ